MLIQRTESVEFRTVFWCITRLFFQVVNMLMQITSPTSTLLIGIGNTSRGDDGLGWALAAAVEEEQLGKLTVVYRHQLQPEDVLLLQQYPIVVFADASVEPVPGGVAVVPCLAAAQAYRSSHQQSPGTLLYLAATLYNAHPQAWMLAMQAATFEFGASLSPTAQINLEKGLQYWRQWWNAHSSNNR